MRKLCHDGEISHSRRKRRSEALHRLGGVLQFEEHRAILDISKLFPVIFLVVCLPVVVCFSVISAILVVVSTFSYAL
jgi:hypothetical protein